jgi:hypothetical protein
MANAKSDYLRSAIVNHVLRASTYTSPSTVYAALFTVAPTSAGGGTEVSTSGTAYARQAITFGAPSPAGSVANSGAVVYPVATASYGTVVAMAVFDAPTAGNMLYFGALGTSKTVGTGDQVSFAIGALTIAET